ncbi:hypothetical protein L484_024640 [Morus notabilis]|uniref:Protein SDA1 n=1 Tax=Morus notabilis TaxID=981085 RepID=W9QS13_9ROSA|nr:hypothetical protein L484_024640 [Morus notabilis]
MKLGGLLSWLHSLRFPAPNSSPLATQDAEVTPTQRMMMLKVIARTVGLHRLLLLNFYPYLQKYVQPHQRDVTNLLAAAVQACHDMVPPDAVEPLFKQIVNQFVHDRSRPEAIAVGLNVIREICLRMPLLMSEELLQDLALYKKSHEKAVSIAARSLIGLFREICPSLLVKKDRGRPTDPKARPKAYGEVNVLSNVPGVELLDQDVEDSDDMDEPASSDSNDDHGHELVASSEDEDDQKSPHDSGSEDDDVRDDLVAEGEDGDNSIDDSDSDISIDDDDDEDEEAEESDQGVEDSSEEELLEEFGEDDEMEQTEDRETKDGESSLKDSKARKRKLSDFDRQLVAADSSLRALKKLAGATLATTSSDSTDGILSNEDFRKIKEMKAKKDAKLALAQHGLLRKGSDAKSSTFSVPSSDQLSTKRVDPTKLEEDLECCYTGVVLGMLERIFEDLEGSINEAHVRKKLSKEERLALVRAGREDRGKYQARAAVKQKKTGGLSNRQKEHKKALPLAAKRAKVAKSRMEKKKKQQRSGKQFRGKKAWK